MESYASVNKKTTSEEDDAIYRQLLNLAIGAWRVTFHGWKCSWQLIPVIEKFDVVPGREMSVLSISAKLKTELPKEQAEKLCRRALSLQRAANRQRRANMKPVDLLQKIRRYQVDDGVKRGAWQERVDRLLSVTRKEEAEIMATLRRVDSLNGNGHNYGDKSAREFAPAPALVSARLDPNLLRLDSTSSRDEI